MPHGLVHAVLNVDDTVAITENYLFVDALPGIYHTLPVQVLYGQKNTHF